MRDQVFVLANGARIKQSELGELHRLSRIDFSQALPGDSAERHLRAIFERHGVEWKDDGPEDRVLTAELAADPANKRIG